MTRKNSRNTKGRIVSAAWKLFYKQGYEATTIDEIVEESETSKGSFYHYFDSKDALLSSLSILFDEKYLELVDDTNNKASTFEKLLFLNRELFKMIENEVSIDLLAMLYSTQLITRDDRHLLDHNRFYYKLLREIISSGIANNEFKEDVTTNDILKAYTMFERALIYDWCLCAGSYSLRRYSEEMMPLMLNGFKK